MKDEYGELFAMKDGGGMPITRFVELYSGSEVKEAKARNTGFFVEDHSIDDECIIGDDDDIFEGDPNKMTGYRTSILDNERGRHF